MVLDTWSPGAFSYALILDSSYWMTPAAIAHCSWFCLGDKQEQADALAQSTVFLFDFNSYPLNEAFPKEPDLPLKSLQDLPWMKRCNIFLRDR